MKVKTNINHQQGVVLIFSLVMLLLLTLVSVNMIQANQLELAMTTNALEQTKELARAEIYLAKAEENIKKRRQIMPPGLCNSETREWKKDVLESDNNNNKATALITQISCLLEEIVPKEYVCCLYDTQQDNCIAPGTGNPYNPKVDKCIAPGTEKPNDPKICDEGNEIYTIKLTTQIAYGTQRTIESKYSVDCTLGQRANPK
jgi:hypothetical protein